MKPLELFDPGMNLLSKVLDLRAANEKVISSNIANAETPGYTATRFEFEQELRQAINRKDSPLTTTNPAHFPMAAAGLESVTGTVVSESDKTGVGDKNNVKVDQEMIALSKNELMYETAAQILQKNITLLGYVIQGGQ
jgi:flagellar basal-body rod protein FlgB